MDLTISSSFLPHTDGDAALGFYRDVLGFEVRADVGAGAYRWITVGPVGQPDTSLVLEPPAMDPALSDEERATILLLLAKGAYARVILSCSDLDATYATVVASGAPIVQEPTEQPYGVRDFAVRDPAGNLVRVNERR